MKEEYGVRNHPKRDYFEPFESRLKGKTFKTPDEFVATESNPVPTEEFAKFLSSHSDLFSSTVFLASIRNNEIALMWSLHLENEFRLLSIYKAAFDHTPFRMSAFKSRINKIEEGFIQKAGAKINREYMQ